MTYIISGRCIGSMDQSCVEICPVDCIHVVQRMAVIDPAECIDCGACLPECPVEAIFQADTLPTEFEPYRAINAAYAQGADAVDRLVADLVDRDESHAA
jgi:NAD-dependent dihydropyrimidine dehydrogenase PreA subunit